MKAGCYVHGNNSSTVSGHMNLLQKREEEGKEGGKEGREKEKKKETKPYSNVYG